MRKELEKLETAFKELETLGGYFTRINFWCCNTCALSDIPDEVEKFVFTHAQSHDDYLENGETYLNWAGNSLEIKSVLEKHGFIVQHDGSEKTKIFIILK